MLSVSQQESTLLSTSWNTANRTGRLADRLFNNLLQTHANLHNEFYNAEEVAEHKRIVGDLLNFIVNNCENEELITEFMTEFLAENTEFSKVAINYLEPLGSVLLTTFKQCYAHQGKVFESQLQGIWIKVYIFLANLILEDVERNQNNVSEQAPEKEFSDEVSPISSNSQAQLKDLSDYSDEVSPINSNDDVSSSYSDESIQPLNIKKEETPASVPLAAPVARAPSTVSDIEASAASKATITKSSDTPTSLTMPPTAASSGKAITFSLNSNEKYKGFRRSAQIPANEPVTVAIPPSSQPITKSNISSSLLSMLSQSSLSTVYNTPPQTPFDPRKKKASRSPAESPVASSALSINDEVPVRRRPSMLASSSALFETNEEFVDVATIESNSPKKEKESERPAPAGRLSLLSKLKTTPVVETDSDSESEKDLPAVPQFDPRRSHRRLHSVNSFSSPESSEVDESEDAAFLAPTSKKVHTPRAHFDYSSFGISGLAPISESIEADNDNASSTYSENTSSHYGDDENSTDLASLSNSTLSLHNSDYRSSISSGTENNFDGLRKTSERRMDNHLRYPSASGSEISSIAPYSSRNGSPTTAAIEQFRNPLQKTSFYSQKTGSASSLLTTKDGSAPRASLGFMRSSFVLKKEMENMGFNHPENVFVKKEDAMMFAKPPTMPAVKQEIPSSADSCPAESMVSGTATPKSVSSDDDCFDMLNSFGVGEVASPMKLEKPKAKKITIHSSRSSGRLSSNDTHAALKMKEKSSFRRKLSNFFGSSSNLSAEVQSSNASISSPKNVSRRSSYAGTLGSTPLKHQNLLVLSYSYSNFSKNDVASINSKESGMSGFSFMNSSSRRSSTMKRGKKYQVKETPFKMFSK